jgi:hypothetical protein
VPRTLYYDNAYINFMYSFAWDLTKKSFRRVSDELLAKGWKAEKLHQRYMDFNGKNRKYGAYRPSLMTGCQSALYVTCEASHALEVVTPLKDEWQQPANRGVQEYAASCPVMLKYYMRLLENGAGVCTLTIGISNPHATFANIQRVLHLGENLSFDARSEGDKTPRATSYLRPRDGEWASCWLKELRDRDGVSLTDTHGKVVALRVAHDDLVDGETLAEKANVFTLQEVVNRLLLLNVEHLPNGWVNPTEPSESLWLDWELLDWKTSGDTGAYVIEYPWQNPYVFTICEVALPSDGRQFSAQDLLSRRAPEMAAILTKMNMESGDVATDFECIAGDYIANALPYSEETKTLLNLSHDDRLFFSFSRRGALAVTARMDAIPGYFVLPSFVNLLEILRARWHLGNSVNVELDRAIEALVWDDGSATDRALDAVYRARLMLVMFLRDPVPYLFDGGAVTEIAQLAETEFWLSRIRVSATEKLGALDKLIQHAKLAEVYATVKKHSADEAQRAPITLDEFNKRLI